MNDNARHREFMGLLESHGPTLKGMLRRLCANDHDADDAFQETATRVWRSLPKRPRLTNPRSWVLTIGYRVFVDSRGRRRRFDELSNPVDPPFVRTDLFLHDIAGRIDVRNDFGRTDLTITSLPDRPHRILSQSGRIEVHLPSQLPHLPLLALTNAGTVQTNASRDLLPIVTFALDNPFDPHQDWRGVVSATPAKLQHEESEIASRLTAALENHDRSPGLDLISRGGSIHIQLDK